MHPVQAVAVLIDPRCGVVLADGRDRPHPAVTLAEPTALARGPGQENSTVLTPQQQAEIDNFRKMSADSRRQLKDVRKELRRDSESLEFWTKVVNIGLVPLLVAIVGLVSAER